MMISSQQLTDLLSRCALGDRQAFERLYQQTSARLFGLVLGIVKDRELAGEVLQEGYIKIWTHAGEFRHDKAAPITWMGAIMRNQAIDLIRRSAHRPPHQQPIEDLHRLADKADGPLERVTHIQQARQLHDCINQLQEAQRQAVLLVFFHGLTHEELAHHLNKPLGTVKSWLRRGLLRLRELC